MQLLMQASQHHEAFLQMTRQKSVSTDMARVKQHVDMAENIYAHLLNQNLDNHQLIYQLATLYMQTDRNGLAIKLLAPLVEREDARIEWVNNLGAAYRNEHMNAPARAAFEQALKIQEHPDVYANLCALWVNEGCPEKGIPFGEKCLEMEPTHKQGTWNLGLLYMENKQYDKGFPLYAKGFETGERHIRAYLNPEGKDCPYWKGEDLTNKTIVLHGEQGIGDEILFMQFVPAFIEAHPHTRIILDLHPRLCELFRRSFGEKYPHVKMFDTRKSRVIPEWNTGAEGVEPIRVDYKDGLGSLPALYWHWMGSVRSYLKPDPVLCKQYKGYVDALNTGKRPVIGLAWTGGRKKTRTDLRSIDLQQFADILRLDAMFVSLEYWPNADKVVSKAIAELGVDIHHFPDVVEGFEYEHAIALASACDVVVSVNTSLVHVCGAIGKRCLTLTPHGHAWRYGLKDANNPFYQTVEQFHQNEGEGWERCLEEVRQVLIKDYCHE